MRLFAGTPFDRPPLCEKCQAPEPECACRPDQKTRPPSAAGIPPQQQVARLSLEKRKKGKQVTVLQGLAASGNDLPELLTRLKSLCGAGGALREGSLEIQGAHVERIREALLQMGYRVER